MSDQWYIPKPEWVEEQAKAPVYWKGNLADVEEAVKSVHKGRVRCGCQTPGKRNVYVVEYGIPNEQNRTATYSSALGARNMNCYSDKVQKKWPDF